MRVKSGKGYKNQRVCSKADPVLQSPISSNALSQGIAPAAAETQLKARTAPDRAYAVDGSTFFHQGRKFRVQGLPDEGAGNELARQRLQNALDGGNLDVNPQTIDEAGVTTAVVRSGTRNLADVLR